jgi:hypothetical protein
VLAAAMLSLETALIRVFALAQGYHFAFVTIGVALLGMGAGGTLLALLPAWREDDVDRVLSFAALGFALAALGSYMLMNVFPFDVYQIAWERAQVAYLVANYVMLATPFFCSGLAIGLALERTQGGHITYAVNLIGSAIGCLVALGALSLFGGAGTVALSAAGGCAAAVLYASCFLRRRRALSVSVLTLCALCAAGVLALMWLLPSWFEVRVSPYRPLSYALQYPGARILSSQWNAMSRVDVVESSAIHVSPGLSLSYEGELPSQRGLYVDASARSAIVGGVPADAEGWADHLPLALVYHLRPGADVLVLEPGGGLDVVVARSLGARHVTAVSSNPLVVDAVRRYGNGLYQDPDVDVVTRSPRSYAQNQRSLGATYEVIDLALNDAQRAVVSGAYALSEDYAYTVQAFVDYLSLLEPGGLLVVQRWLQTPPSEGLRAWALAVEGVEQAEGFGRESLLAIRSWSTVLILVKKGDFTAVELQAVRQFCDDRQFDLVYLTGLGEDEANRHNVYKGAPYYHGFADLVSQGRKDAFYRAYAYDVRPPTDGRPYYHHFFRWQQVPEIWQSLGRTWQPFGGGGYLVLVAILIVAVLASTVLIALPVVFGRRALKQGSRLPKGPILTYFGLLGIAYLAVEIPLIQRLVLFVDHPTFAFVTVVAVLLVSSGVGSLLASRLQASTILALVVYLVLLLTILPVVTGALLRCALLIRVAIACTFLAPLGLLMGVPFPAGIALLRRVAPSLIPWAWGVNGCTSVVASIGTALIALQWGFSVVLGLAVASYALAWWILRYLTSAEFAYGGKA